MYGCGIAMQKPDQGSSGEVHDIFHSYVGICVRMVGGMLQLMVVDILFET